eukprot:scaffold26701_cov127-Cylindrotheca_fusiformis.AAC.3
MSHFLTEVGHSCGGGQGEVIYYRNHTFGNVTVAIGRNSKWYCGEVQYKILASSNVLRTEVI